MNRMDFMNRLSVLLSDLPENERKEAMEYYNDYLNDAGVENEGEVLEALGTPEELAATIREGLQDAQGQQGVFSEEGFQAGPRSRGNEIIARPQGVGENTDAASAREGGAAEGVQNGPRSGARTDAGGKDVGGSGRFGERRNPGGNGAEPNAGSGAKIDAGSGARSATDGSGDPRNLNRRYRQDSGKKHLSGGMIVLLTVLAVFALPVIIAVGIGLLTALVVLALAAIFFTIVFLFGGVILICAGLICLAASVAKLAAFPAAALLSMGISFLCIGGGIFLTLAIGWVVTKLFPPLFRKAAGGVRTVTHRKQGKDDIRFEKGGQS